MGNGKTGALAALERPLVQAPMAGGPSTVELAAAVCGAGGLGFLATGYRDRAACAADVRELRARTDAPFGVNLFVPGRDEADARAVAAYAERIRPEAERLGAELGEPRYSEDGFEEKVALLEELRPAVVSFTFGCPPPAVLERLRRAGCELWLTVTTPAEARAARDAGADALVLQGAEAGGHQGSWEERPDTEPLSLLTLLRLVAAEVELPLVAAGGVTDAGGLAAVIAAGAGAAQAGTAFMLAPEAGTSAPHREAFRSGRPTALTRAFSGRTARGIRNRFLDEHSAAAPAAYPQVHYLTSPLRAAARERGEPELVNLWAGTAYPLAVERPAAETVRALAALAS